MNFEFRIEKMAHEQAEFLMDLIIRVAEFFGLEIAGGYHESPE